MTRTLRLAALLSTLPAARAQDVPAPAPQPATPGLQPFVATYQVLHDGHELGEATLQLVHVGGARWRIDLGMQGRGLVRLTGLNLQQSTLFETDGQVLRPLAQSTVKRHFLSTRRTVGVYDWAARTARWTGDVRDGHDGPIALP